MPWTTSAPIRITVPGPPKALARNRTRIVNRKGGGQFVANYMPAESAKEQSSIRKFAYDAMGSRAPLDGPIDLRVVAYMPITPSWSQRKQMAALADQIRPTGRPDFDNLVKNLADAFKGIVWRDDTLVTEGMIWKRYSDRPRLLIEVRLLIWQP